MSEGDVSNRSKALMTAAQLNARLKREGIVALSAAEWMAVAGGFEEMQRHQTFIAGDLLIVKGDAGFAAVEQPSPDQRVVRHLRDSDDVHRFVLQRMGEYERMWDGCGCRIDYYA